MNKIIEIDNGWNLRNIHNQDVAGMMYRMDPNKAYLLQEENSSEIRGVRFQHITNFLRQWGRI